MVYISGNSTVADKAIRRDKFHAYVDAVVRGARIINITPMA